MPDRLPLDTTFRPPASVASRARRWLDLRAKQAPSSRGAQATGLRRASQLANRQPVSLQTMIVMRAWFARHAVDLDAPAAERGHPDYPSPGRQAWELWGGEPARAWVSRVLRESGYGR